MSTIMLQQKLHRNATPTLNTMRHGDGTDAPGAFDAMMSLAHGRSSESYDSDLVTDFHLSCLAGASSNANAITLSSATGLLKNPPPVAVITTYCLPSRP